MLPIAARRDPMNRGPPDIKRAREISLSLTSLEPVPDLGHAHLV